MDRGDDQDRVGGEFEEQTGEEPEPEGGLVKAPGQRRRDKALIEESEAPTSQSYELKVQDDADFSAKRKGPLLQLNRKGKAKGGPPLLAACSRGWAADALRRSHTAVVFIALLYLMALGKMIVQAVSRSETTTTPLSSRGVDTRGDDDTLKSRWATRGCEQRLTGFENYSSGTAATAHRKVLMMSAAYHDYESAV